jgi:hypothetical protein
MPIQPRLSYVTLFPDFRKEQSSVDDIKGNHPNPLTSLKVTDVCQLLECCSDEPSLPLRYFSCRSVKNAAIMLK